MIQISIFWGSSSFEKLCIGTKWSHVKYGRSWPSSGFGSFQNKIFAGSGTQL